MQLEVLRRVAGAITLQSLHCLGKKRFRARARLPSPARVLLFDGAVDDAIKNERDLWEVKKDTAYVHPTQKPVALSVRAFGNHVKLTSVLDLFGGSGSTLIGAEKTGRDANVMELDPKYCDVIIKRWQNFTGEKAIHEESGKSYNEMRDAQES